MNQNILDAEQPCLNCLSWHHWKRDQIRTIIRTAFRKCHLGESHIEAEAETEEFAITIRVGAAIAGAMDGGMRANGRNVIMMIIVGATHMIGELQIQSRFKPYFQLVFQKAEAVFEYRIVVS